MITDIAKPINFGGCTVERQADQDKQLLTFSDAMPYGKKHTEVLLGF